MRGQALTEFLAIALVLLPLFLLLPMIGKIQDIAHQTQMASRHAAFDAVLRNDSHNRFKPPQDIERELRHRFFGVAGAIKTGSLPEAFSPRPDWSDPYANPLISTPGDVTLSFGPSHGNAHRDAWIAASDTERFLLASPLGLDSKGIYQVNVSAKLANLPAGLKLIEPFDQLNLRIERHASVLIDPWTARSPVQAEERFGRVAAVNAPLQKIAPLVGAMIEYVDLSGVTPPSFGTLERWRDLVPADRVVNRRDAP
jgi:hypothetical protein